MKALSLNCNRLLFFFVALLVLAGCRKRSYPEYYEWESRVSVLVAQDGDEAYGLPEMKELLTRIDGVPADAYEWPKAKVLSDSIHSEMARIERERKELENERQRQAAAAAAAPRLAPSPTAPSAPTPAAAPAEAQRPDPKVPYGGMPLEEFQKEHGSCMSSLSSTVKDEVKFQNVDSSDCRGKYGLSEGANVIFTFRQGLLAERSTETRTRVIIDAGKPAAPPAPKTPPEPQMQFIFPGAPRPDAPSGKP